MRIETRRITWPIEGRGAARGRSERTSVIVALHAGDGIVGLGEAAPLPGVSRETIEDVERAIAAGDTTLPSARFALETARLDAEALARRCSIAALLGGAARRTPPRAVVASGAEARAIPFAAVVDSLAEARAIPFAAVVDSLAEARAAWDRGLRCLKLKLRADELALAHAIADALPGVRLRIDANQSWPRAQVRELLASLPRDAIEYVEEPCVDTLSLLAEPLPVPIALDESLALLAGEIGAIARNAGRATLAGDSGAIAILKPTLLGLQRCLAFAGDGVVTHALEGPIGTAACAELARARGGDRAVGLAPHPALAGWPAAVPQLTATHVVPAIEPGLGFTPAERRALWEHARG